jgi:hypothetical protein
MLRFEALPSKMIDLKSRYPFFLLNKMKNMKFKFVFKTI